jgi:hypothetical protein
VIGARRGISGGVLVLLGEAFVDLLLLPARIAFAIAFARAAGARSPTLIRSKSIHAPQDAHPPR